MALTDTLTRPVGPLPLWGWGAVGVGGFLVYRVVRGGTSGGVSVPIASTLPVDQSGSGGAFSLPPITIINNIPSPGAGSTGGGGGGGGGGTKPGGGGGSKGGLQPPSLHSFPGPTPVTGTPPTIIEKTISTVTSPTAALTAPGGVLNTPGGGKIVAFGGWGTVKNQLAHAKNTLLPSRTNPSPPVSPTAPMNAPHGVLQTPAGATLVAFGGWGSAANQAAHEKAHPARTGAVHVTSNTPAPSTHNPKKPSAVLAGHAVPVNGPPTIHYGTL